MSLFNWTPFGYLVKIGDRDQLRDQLSAYNTADKDDSNSVILSNMLMWELEGQMKKIEQHQKEKLATGSGNLNADYTWLKHATSKAETTIPRRLKLQMEDLCRKIEPSKSNVVVERFRQQLLKDHLDIEEVPPLFSSVLRSVFSEQEAEKKKGQILDYPLRLADRIWKRLQKTNKVGVIDDDVESRQGEGELSTGKKDNRNNRFVVDSNCCVVEYREDARVFHEGQSIGATTKPATEEESDDMRWAFTRDSRLREEDVIPSREECASVSVASKNPGMARRVVAECVEDIDMDIVDMLQEDIV